MIKKKRPLSDFIDRRLNENLNIVDFESILEAADCFVAKSGKARPGIDIIFSEMDKAWKNTMLEKVLILRFLLKTKHYLVLRG